MKLKKGDKVRVKLWKGAIQEEIVTVVYNSRSHGMNTEIMVYWPKIDQNWWISANVNFSRNSEVPWYGHVVCYNPKKMS